MNPELFATPWFLTLFASKMSVELIYAFWDNYMIENDNLFICFFCLAYLLHFRNTIINKETSVIPQTISQLQLESVAELNLIVLKAK
jgi:hypothetical protein